MPPYPAAPIPAWKSCSPPVIDDILFICDNGARTIYRGRVLNCYTIRRELAFEIIRDIEALPGCTTYVSALKNGYVKEGADELYRWLTKAIS